MLNLLLTCLVYYRVLHVDVCRHGVQEPDVMVEHISGVHMPDKVKKVSLCIFNLHLNYLN
jgi:hypothetical protein